MKLEIMFKCEVYILIEYSWTEYWTSEVMSVKQYKMVYNHYIHRSSLLNKKCGHLSYEVF